MIPKADSFDVSKSIFIKNIIMSVFPIVAS